jgi:DNA-binding NtrC family response regulator
MSAAHILVVDDEADIRSLLKEILSEEGYEVDVAANAVQARASRQTSTASRCCANGRRPTPMAARW